MAPAAASLQREAVMARLVKTILAVGLLVGESVGSSYANGWEINNIWWNVIVNYNSSGQTICLAEQFNSEPFTATTFAVYPVSDHSGGYGSATQRNMRPNVQYRIFSWPDGAKPEPKCVLRSWTKGATRVTAPAPVPSWRLVW
jgi:hypothetical protein